MRLDRAGMGCRRAVRAGATGSEVLIVVVGQIKTSSHSAGSGLRNGSMELTLLAHSARRARPAESGSGSG